MKKVFLVLPNSAKWKIGPNVKENAAKISFLKKLRWGLET